MRPAEQPAPLRRAAQPAVTKPAHSIRGVVAGVKSHTATLLNQQSQRLQSLTATLHKRVQPPEKNGLPPVASLEGHLIYAAIRQHLRKELEKKAQK